MENGAQVCAVFRDRPYLQALFLLHSCMKRCIQDSHKTYKNTRTYTPVIKPSTMHSIRQDYTCRFMGKPTPVYSSETNIIRESEQIHLLSVEMRFIASCWLSHKTTWKL
jgi:hypothetical protein